MEEAAQVLEIETFIPLLLQSQRTSAGRLKRAVFIGDHNQLPPVIQNMAFQKYSRMDQSLFARLIRLGVPAVQLNYQVNVFLFSCSSIFFLHMTTLSLVTVTM